MVDTQNGVTKFENGLESETDVLIDECDLGMVISKSVKVYFKISGLQGWINFGSTHYNKDCRKTFRFKQENSNIQMLSLTCF